MSTTPSLPLICYSQSVFHSSAWSASMRVLLVIYLCVFVAVCEQVEKEKHEVTTFRYPTATWSAANFHSKRKKFDPETQKLYLFKPSPFLKPPFTDGVIGAAITKVENVNVNVSGRRRGKIRWKEYEINNLKAAERRNFISEPTEPPKDAKFVDKFLEDSLMKYLRSANLTDDYGTLSVDAFSEALKRVVAEKSTTTSTYPPYHKNKELRRKFRDEMLNKKKHETSTASAENLLEKLYQRRLQKTWEIINENISVPSRSAVLEPKEDWRTLTPEISASTSNPVTVADSEEQEAENYSIFATTTVATTSSAFPVSDSSVTESPHTEAVTTTTEVSTENVITTFRPSYASKKKSKTSRGSKKFNDIVLDKSWVEEELKLSVAESSYYGSGHNRQAEEPEYGAIPGVPDRDYPMLSSPPSTGFKCPPPNGDAPRMMADRATRCQVFYICTNEGPPAPMLCPNGTLFNENVLVCDWWYNVSC